MAKKKKYREFFDNIVSFIDQNRGTEVAPDDDAANSIRCVLDRSWAEIEEYYDNSTAEAGKRYKASPKKTTA